MNETKDSSEYLHITFSLFLYIFSFMFKFLRNGQSVPDSTNKCHTCTCHNGDVRCVQKQCPAVTCTHPVQGDCCQECDDCMWNENWRVTNGGQVNDDSQCKVCECQDGTMVCYPKHCPSVPCSHPAVDKCCPHCENCLIDGELVLNGKQKISDSNRPCRQCICKVKIKMEGFFFKNLFIFLNQTLGFYCLFVYFKIDFNI